MRIAADTNVVVRFLTEDDPEQTPLAVAAIESAYAVVLSTVVLCEIVWVLRRAYGFTAAEVLGVLRRLVDSAAVETDRAAADAGLTMLEAGGDFADGVILHDAKQRRCDALVTFDTRFARFAADDRVRLLAPA